MNINNIENNIIKIISEIMEISIDKISTTTHLKKNLKVDSLDIIEIIMAIEKKFNLTIPDEIIETFNTVESIIQYVKNIKNCN